MTSPAQDGSPWDPPPKLPAGQGQDAAPTSTYGVPFGRPTVPPRGPRQQLASTGDVVAALVSAAVMLVAGVPMGLLWGSTVQRVDVADLLGNTSETALERQPGADARFAVLAIIFGLVAGAVAGWRARRNGWPVPVGLVLGGLGGSLIAAQVGHMLASSKALAAVPPTVNPLVRQVVDVVVRAHGVHVLYPLVALLVFLVVVLVTTRAEPLSVPDAPPPAGAWWSTPR